MNGIVLLDKGQGDTSRRACDKVKRLFANVKTGHTGTLDPLATGLLPVLLGSATGLSNMLMEGDKEYIATFCTGILTDSGDITGNVIRKDDQNPSQELVEKAISQFIGEYLQLPPMYSAIKKEGKKLYEYARLGIDIDRELRRVKINNIKLLECNPPEYKILVECSKGTYIRTLCENIGTKSGSCATIKELRRTKTGGFSVVDAYTVEELEKISIEGNLAEKIISPEDLFLNYPIYKAEPFYERLFINGAAVLTKKLKELPMTDKIRFYTEEGFFGIAQIIQKDNESYLKVHWRV